MSVRFIFALSFFQIFTFYQNSAPCSAFAEFICEAHLFDSSTVFFEFLFVYLIFLNIVCSFYSILLSVFFFLLNISFALLLYIAVCLSIDFKNKSSKWLLRKCATIIFAIKRSQTNTRKTPIDECMYFGVTMWWVPSSIKNQNHVFRLFLTKFQIHAIIEQFLHFTP